MLQRFIQGMIVIFFSSVVVIAQSDVCAAVVEAAFQSAIDNCTDTPINTVCYAHDTVRLSPADSAFSSVGDTALLSDVEGISLSAFDESTDEWGVAVLHVQANHEDAPEEGVRITLFGETTVSNIDDTGSSFNVSSTADDAACDEMPPSGLVISIPATLVDTEITINGVTLSSAGSVYIAAEAGGAMIILPVGASAEVGVEGGVSTIVNSGTAVSLPLEDDLSPGGDISDSEMDERDHSTLLTLLTVVGVDIIPEDGEFHQELLVVCPRITNNFDGDVVHIFEFDGSTLTMTPGDQAPMVLDATGAPGVYQGIVTQEITGNVYDVTLTITSEDSFHVFQIGADCVLTGVFTRN